MVGTPLCSRDTLVRGLTLAVMYFTSAWLVARLDQHGGWGWSIFPAAGIALGGCICCGNRMWPGVWLGSLAFYYYFLTQMIPFTSLPAVNLALAVSALAFAATAQALLGSLLYNRYIHSLSPLHHTRDVLIFIFGVAALGSTFSGSINVVVMSLLDHKPWAEAIHHWITLWLGDIMGVLLVSPLFFIFRQPLNFKWTRGKRIEALILALLFYVTSQLVFGDWLGYHHYPLVYALFPCLVWAAYRFDHPGTVLGVILVSVAAVWGTLNGRGPFVLRSMNESLALLQSYLLVLTVMTLILSAAATESEIAQRESTQFGRILDESSNEILLFDANSLKFIQANRGAQENLGYTLEELHTMTPLDLKPDFTRADFEKILKPLRQGTENLVIFQTRHQRKDGSFYPVEARVQLSHSEVWPVYVAILMDITEKKKTEEELMGYRSHLEDLVKKRTVDLESAHRQLLHAEKLSATGKMAASMAHEFNNPIFGIRNVLEKILRRIQLDEKNKRFVELAIRECDRVTNLIRKILDFHSPSSDEIEPINIHEAIDDMILLISKQFRERNIRLIREFSPDMPRIEAVPDQFKQVILNLLQNAEEAIPGRGGSVTITTSAWDGRAQIQIRDTGTGIAPEVMKNIFDPFFTTKPAVKGTGLGLSVTYGIIKKHGGEILVDSLPGRGTTFTLFFPVRSNRQAQLVS